MITKWWSFQPNMFEHTGGWSAPQSCKDGKGGSICSCWDRKALP